MEPNPVSPLFNVHPMTSAVQQGRLASSGNYAQARAMGSSNFGNQRQFAWDTGRGHGGAVESLNANNAGSFRKFDAGPQYQPVEAR